MPEMPRQWEMDEKTMQFQGPEHPKKIDITGDGKHEIRQFVDIMFICRESFTKSFQFFRVHRRASPFSINLHKHNILFYHFVITAISCKNSKKMGDFCLECRNLVGPFVQTAD